MFALLVVGVVLLGVGGWLYRQGRQVAARGDALRSAPLLGCAEAAGRAAGGALVCQLAGAAEPGPAGPLTAPLSGQPCVWYHVRVSARKRGADGLSYDRRTHEESSTTPFELRDATGAVLVDPRGLAADFVTRTRPAHPDAAQPVSYPQTVRRFEPKGGEHLIDLKAFGSIVGINELVGHLYEEWVITPAAPAHLLGSVRSYGGQPRIAQPGTGPYLLSMRDPGRQAQAAQLAAGLRGAPALAVLAAGAALTVIGLLTALL